MTDRADILGTDPRRLPPTDGLWAPAIAPPIDVPVIERATGRVMQMPGASQEAREAIAPHLNALQRKVLLGIAALGPVTRDALAEALCMSPNTLRPRVCELLDLNRIHVVGYTPTPRRELLAATTPPEDGQ